MTNEELVMKLLDGNLSDAERAELESRLAAQPDFGADVREMQSLEQALTHSARALHNDFAPLTAQVEHKISQQILERQSAAAHAAQPKSRRKQLLLLCLACLGLIGMISGLSLLVYTPGQQQLAVQDSPAPAEISVNPAPANRSALSQQDRTTSAIDPEQHSQAPEVAESVNAEGRDESPADAAAKLKASPEPARIIAPASPADSPERTQIQSPSSQAESSSAALPDEVDVDLKAQSKAASDDSIRKLLAHLQRKKTAMTQSGDRTGAAMLALRIGRLEREAGAHERSRSNLQFALDVFQGAGHTAQLAETHGDIGLLEMAAGQYNAAVYHFKQCIALSGALHAGSTAGWERRLAEAQGHLPDSAQDK